MSTAGRAGRSGMSPAPHPVGAAGSYLGVHLRNLLWAVLAAGEELLIWPQLAPCRRLSRLDLAVAKKGTQVCSHVSTRDSSPGRVVTDCTSTD